MVFGLVGSTLVILFSVIMCLYTYNYFTSNRVGVVGDGKFHFKSIITFVFTFISGCCSLLVSIIAAYKDKHDEWRKEQNKLKNVKITRSESLVLSEIDMLVEESDHEGFRHLKRLVNEYQAGINRFDKQGEALFVAYAHNRIVGICGLTQDPYSQEGTIGRVRRLYVSKDFRGSGIGSLLMDEIMKEAKLHYRTLVLKTDNPIADKFYCSLGFELKTNDLYITHYLQLV